MNRSCLCEYLGLAKLQALYSVVYCSLLMVKGNNYIL